MAVLMGVFTRATAPRLISPGHNRITKLTPFRRILTAVPRAQQQEGGGEVSKDVPARQETGLTQRSPATLDTVSPSWNRVNQMWQEMDREMNQLARAFGMPMGFQMPSLFTDLPSIAATADLPTARAMLVDIKDTPAAIEISADVPGMTASDIRVQVSPDQVLTISAERQSESKEGSEEGGNLRVERHYGQFVRRFRLPDNVDIEGIKASIKDGVLRLTVPKTEEARPKQIDIQVSE